MAKRYPHSANIGDGQRVGYSALERTDRGRWEVMFTGPDGKRNRKLTQHELRGKTPPEAFHEDAERLIRDVYRPPSLFPSLDRKNWEELLDEVERTSPHSRAETHRWFRQSVRAFRETLPDVASPLDISEERVKRFARLWLAAAKKGGGKRSPVSLSYYLRGLSAFSNHLIELGYLSRNLWQGTKAPKAERKRKHVPDEKEAGEFFGWIVSRFPEWHSLHVLLQVKAISACRTADLCQLKTDQLRAGRLTFTADIVKTKEERSVPIPPDMFVALKATAGPVWIWEGFFRDLPKFRKQSNGLPESFNWKTVYSVIMNIFREYRETFPDRPPFTPHALRRRAITATVRATGSVDAAASAIGIHAQTARAHYLDATQAFRTDEVMASVAESLRLPIAPSDGNKSTINPPVDKSTSEKPGK